MQVIGTVKEIWRYPVKSMAGERMQRANVSALRNLRRSRMGDSR